MAASIKIRKKTYTAEIDKINGRLLSFKSFGNEMLTALAADQHLMELRFVDPVKRELKCITEKGAAISVKENGADVRITAEAFPSYPGLKITVIVTPKEDYLEYRSEISNDTDFYLENYVCPCITVTDRLCENGGVGQVFWARSEGVVISDVNRCFPHRMFDESNSSELLTSKYVYPGNVTMQYLAYMTQRSSLYYGSHDTAGMPKVIAPWRTEFGLRLDIRLFACICPHSDWKQEFPIVLRPFTGNWEDAAEIYREFIENSGFPLPPTIYNNPAVPAWVFDSPVFAIYPPRGVRGTDYMGPNEFFPYSNGLKYIRDISERTSSKVMAFLTYWEGSAPWAPPFVWPPYGGEESLCEYINAMHEEGHYVGLYNSGLHWTDKSLILPSYNMKKYRAEHDLTKVMCKDPHGNFAKGPCSSIRDELVMCCACKETVDIAADQLSKIVSSGVDYVQYFDQHMGGEGVSCYSDSHGHPPCFGDWNSRAMKTVFEMSGSIGREYNTEVTAVGAEGAAADYYCSEIPICENRGHVTFQNGIPVPAANYVLHEYEANFMDNMCCFSYNINRHINPDSFLYSLAYSFVYGDAITLVLKSGGEIQYDWGQSWLEPGPPQEPILNFVKKLNALRSGPLKSFLIGGRMMKTPDHKVGETFSMIRLDGSAVNVPGVLSSCWKNSSDEVVQIFVNYRHRDIPISVSASYYSVITELSENTLSGPDIVVPPLSAIAIRLSKENE